MMRRAIVAIGVLSVVASARTWDLSQTLPTAGDVRSNFSISLVASHRRVRPGQTVHVAVDIRIGDSWVYYSPDPGEIAQPARIAVRSEQLTAGEVLWPPDHTKTSDLAGTVVTNNVYEGRAVAYVPLTVPDDAAPGAYSVQVSAGGQICHETRGTCVPVEKRATVDIGVGQTTVAAPAWREDPSLAAGLAEAMTAQQLRASHRRAATQPAAPVLASRQARELTVWTGLPLAVLAGLILNVMPCVLPVIPLRIIGLVNMGGDSRRRYVTLGLAFAGGILIFFAGLAVVNIVLRLAWGRAFSWSEHFQSPAIRIGLAMLIAALAANLFGLFDVTVPRRLAALEARDEKRRRGGHLGSVGMGLMMAILATPCSFAILALALAWAQLQPLWLGTLAILLIGVGMALPHAVLSGFPQLLNKLPKPGAWMEKLKKTMGFLLLPVVVWLIGTLSEETYVSWVFAYAVVLAFGLWVWGSWVRYDASWTRKLLVRGLVAVSLVGLGWWMLTPPKPLAVSFEPFDRARVAEARGDGRPVVVKFTAAWCISCKWVDATIYDDPEIAEQIRDHDALAVKADVTNADSPASAYLADAFGGAPPLTAVLPPGDGQAILLEGKFSKQTFIEALERASKT